MDTRKIPKGSRQLGFCLFVLVATFFLAVAFFGPRVAGVGAAAGDGRTKVAEATFPVNVEPIKVQMEVVEGYPYSMNPDDTAILGVKISNLSKTTDHEVVVEISPPLINGYYTSDLVSITAYLENGALFQPGHIMVVGAGTVRELRIGIQAMDGAGTEGIKISVYRLPP